MITFRCELCKKEYQFNSGKELIEGGLFHNGYIGSINISNNICHECYLKLNKKDAVLKRQSTIAMKNWLISEFIGVKINNGKIERKEINK